MYFSKTTKTLYQNATVGNVKTNRNKNEFVTY